MSLPAALTGVGRTALSVARVRTRETDRPDALFSDPFARAFLAAYTRAAPGQPITSESPPSLRATLALQVTIRTRFYDDYLLAATAAGCRQVVLLAAGLDARAFRLPWPEVARLFELDLPGVLAFKESVLAELGAAPRRERTVIAADLRGDWPAQLCAAGFKPAQPTAWLVEGLLIYLSPDEADSILTAVGALSAPGSQLAVERGNTHATLIAQAQASDEADRISPLWQGGLGQDAAEWLGAHGWQPTVHDLVTLAVSYGRSAPAGSVSGFVTASRQESVEGWLPSPREGEGRGGEGAGHRACASRLPPLLQCART